MTKKKPREGASAMKLFLSVILAIAVLAVVYYWNSHQMNRSTIPEPTVIVPYKVSMRSPSLERPRDGRAVVYYDNGNIKAERNYKDGKLEGIYRSYYENGVLKESGTYQNDKMHGVFKRFHPDGRLKAEEIYEDNLLIHRNSPD